MPYSDKWFNGLRDVRYDGLTYTVYQNFDHQWTVKCGFSDWTRAERWRYGSTVSRQMAEELFPKYACDHLEYVRV